MEAPIRPCPSPSVSEPPALARCCRVALWAPLLLAPACQDYKFKGGDDVPPGFDTGDTWSPPVDTSAAPDIVVTPLAQDLGELATPTPVSGTVDIANIGDADLHLAGLASTWTLAPDLAGSVLAPGDSVSVTASTIATAGTQTANVVITSDDPDSPEVTASLTYTGVDDPCSWAQWKPDDGCDGGWPGTGVDGDVTLTSFAVPSTELVSPAAGTTLDVADASGFAVDDEVWLYDVATGTSAFGHVVALAPLTLATAVTMPELTLVQRVPHYTDVTIDGDLDASGFVVFRACGTVTVNGRFGPRDSGFSGGRETTGIPENGWQGATAASSGTQSTAANGTGGGGGGASCNVHTDGGGGGHATPGGQGGSDSGYPCVGPPGDGGGTVGEPDLATIHLGGGGGSGYLDNDATAGSFGGAGGAGGGIVRIIATAFTGSGTIHADGEPGEDGYWIGGASPGGGGGGAGGTVWLTGEVGVNLSAVGGSGGEGSEAGSGITYGGAGGDGRIRVDGTMSGASTPSAWLGCE